MKIPIKLIKTTLIGGIVFLVPLAIVLAVTGKLFMLTRKLVAPLGALVPGDSIAGILIVNLIAVVVILLLCFIAGLIAKSTIGAKISKTVESKLYLLVPRYAFVKSMTASVSDLNDDLKGLKPIRVTFDDYVQIAFEVERTAKELVTVYLPGAPDAWAGSIVHVTRDRIEPLDVDFMTVVKALSKVGIGSEEIIESQSK